MIATAGGIDVHVHFDSRRALRGGDRSRHHDDARRRPGPVTVGICSSGTENLARMLQAAEAFPLNFGFLGNGSASAVEPLLEQIRAGAIGLKIHEDWGAMPAVIHASLDAGDELDVQIQIHTDTLNESGFFERHDRRHRRAGRSTRTTRRAPAAATRPTSSASPASRTASRPRRTRRTRTRVNTFDEHLDMVMVCHHLNPRVPEDVAFAESRIRRETIAAEDVLHDLGAISVIGSDSQGMGRIGETIARTWQVAAHMKAERGSLPEDAGTGNDNARIKRYVAKYTMNAARIYGIDHEIGSLEPGKLADVVLWEPKFFGHQAGGRFQGRLPCLVGDGRVERLADDVRAAHATGRSGARSDGAAGASRSPSWRRPRSTQASPDGSASSRRCVGRAARERSRSATCSGTTPSPEIRVDPETYRVEVDGELCTCEPIAARPARPPLRPQVSAVRIGVGGPVGSGKTRLLERLLPLLHADGLRVAVITNDLVTTEDAERLQPGGLIAPELVVGVETGACPHTAIREDPSMNLAAVERLERDMGRSTSILLESGGDNLAATFSADLVDHWLYVIDVAAGDDIPRKRGLGSAGRSARGEQGRPGSPCRGRHRANAGRPRAGAPPRSADVVHRPAPRRSPRPCSSTFATRFFFDRARA